MWEQARPRPEVKALNLSTDKTFFFRRNQDLYLLFCPRISLILCFVFFWRLNFFSVFL